jgi:signal transduction histidine kinase
MQNEYRDYRDLKTKLNELINRNLEFGRIRTPSRSDAIKLAKCLREAVRYIDSAAESPLDPEVFERERKNTTLVHDIDCYVALAKNLMQYLEAIADGS